MPAVTPIDEFHHKDGRSIFLFRRPDPKVKPQQRELNLYRPTVTINRITYPVTSVCFMGDSELNYWPDIMVKVNKP